ncbi:hypothetical protein SAMN02745166_02220 [Prosthecobacter debontii]|uniref:Uncharacterized protein n=1 Tax=Prosthecobacter debontii TaxID=48467 RepID=A0A1T4XZ65_9BACT|nr:hypothetical protein [Prosthecobacter debontii]SKA94852.1 hypothetical protein SAMN02745166_02220 [Prosthecobacter debontii]
MKPIKDIPHLQQILADGARDHANSQKSPQPRPCIFIPFTTAEQQRHVDDGNDKETMRQQMEKQAQNSGLRSVGVALYQDGKVGPNPTTDELINALNGVDEPKRKEILQQAVLETPYIVEYDGTPTQQPIPAGTTVVIAGHGDGTVPYIASGHGPGTYVGGQKLLDRLDETGIPQNIGAISLQTCGANLKFHQDISRASQSSGSYAGVDVISYGLPQENSSLYIQKKPLQKLDLGMQNVVTKDGSRARHDLDSLNRRTRGLETQLKQAKDLTNSADSNVAAEAQRTVHELQTQIDDHKAQILTVKRQIEAANIPIQPEHRQRETLIRAPMADYANLAEFTNAAELHTFLQDRADEMNTPQDIIYVPFSPDEPGSDQLLQQAQDIVDQTTLRKLATSLYEEKYGDQEQTIPWTPEELVQHLNESPNWQRHLHDALSKKPAILQYDPNGQQPENPRPFSGTVHILANGDPQSDLIRPQKAAAGQPEISAAELVNRLENDQAHLPSIKQIKLQVDGGRGAFHQSLLQHCQSRDLYQQASLTSYGLEGQDSTLKLTHKAPLQDLHLGNRSVSPPNSPERQAQAARIANLQQSLTKAQERLDKLQDIQQMPSEEQAARLLKMLQADMLQIVLGNDQGLPDAAYLQEHILELENDSAWIDIDILDQQQLVQNLQEQLDRQPALDNPSPAKGNKVRDLFKRQSAPGQAADAHGNSHGH